MSEIAVTSVDDLWAWMNTWGDLHEDHDLESREWKHGYEEAMMDLMYRLRQMGVTYCSAEAWGKFTGRSVRAA